VRLAVGANHSLNGLLAHNVDVFVGSCVDRGFEAISFELKGVNHVVPESRVASPTFVFVIRHEQSLRAALARVHAYVLAPPMVSCERSFPAHLLSDMELNGRESLSQEIDPEFEMLSPPPQERFCILPGPILEVLDVFDLPQTLLDLHLESPLFFSVVFVSPCHSQQVVSYLAIGQYSHIINFINNAFNFAHEFGRLLQ
jgi:hypothetical protein